MTIDNKYKMGFDRRRLDAFSSDWDSPFVTKLKINRHNSINSKRKAPFPHFL